jgi:Xaa-Pro aminopeptidase
MNSKLNKLIEAEKKAAFLFSEIENRNLIQVGKSEKELNQEIFELAFELFSIKKYWHKRIVRAGKNTLLPYAYNPENLVLADDDILFFDFGPVFEDWEADFGRTYVIGDNTSKIKLKNDVENAWIVGNEFYQKNRYTLTGADFYKFTLDLAQKFSWKYGNEHCGHLIGNFPHEKLQGDEKINYIHPENHSLMSDLDSSGNERFWIYEIHFTDENLGFGAFFEQMLTSNI